MKTTCFSCALAALMGRVQAKGRLSFELPQSVHFTCYKTGHFYLLPTHTSEKCLYEKY